MAAINSYKCSQGRSDYKKTMKSVEAHEERCFYNPETRSCGSCIYLMRGVEAPCAAGVEFNEGKLKTQCVRYVNDCEDPEEAFGLLYKHGIIKSFHP